jgi:tetratricopeptide (TPR) repeat protein
MMSQHLNLVSCCHNLLLLVISDSIRKEPKRDELYFNRAVLLNKNNFPEPALADFKKAWSLKKDERYAVGISTILLERNPDSAILFLNNALRELPESFLLQLSLARNYDAQNRTDEALKVCNDMLAKNPDQVDLLKMKAGLLNKKGSSVETIAILTKAYNLTPFDAELNNMLAIKLAETKNSRVLSLTDSLIRADSMGLSADPYYYKGIYYSNTGDNVKALSNFDLAIKHNYRFLESYIEKGSILFDEKKFSEAIKVFNLALTVSPEYADAYYWVGKCQEALGQKEDAKLNYEKAYALDKTFTQAKEAADKLK